MCTLSRVSVARVAHFFCIAPPLKPFHPTQIKHRFHEHGFWFLGKNGTNLQRFVRLEVRRRSFEFQLLVTQPRPRLQHSADGCMASRSPKTCLNMSDVILKSKTRSNSNQKYQKITCCCACCVVPSERQTEQMQRLNFSRIG